MLSGKQISEARKRKGLTQEALASELGVSRQTIAKWEQEISTPSVANAYKLMNILGLQDIEKKSSIDDVESEDKKNSISKKKITKKLMIELWAIYVGIAFLCFFFIGIAALLFLPDNINCPNITCYCSTRNKRNANRVAKEVLLWWNMLYRTCATDINCYTCELDYSKRKLSAQRFLFNSCHTTK